MSPVPIMVVLVPVLFVLMVPVTAPGRIVIATTIVELSFPLPVASICITEVSLVGVIVVISWVSMHHQSHHLSSFAPPLLEIFSCGPSCITYAIFEHQIL